jgi:tripartite ATP-independent transporter DctP family solute receptor
MEVDVITMGKYPTTIAVLFVLGLTVAIACGGAASSPATTVYAIRAVTSDTRDTPGGHMLAAFAKEVEANSNGRVVVQTFYLNELGTNQDTLAQTLSGTLQVNVNTLDYLATSYPASQTTDLPFLFSSVTQAEKAMNGPVGSQISQAILAHTGLRVLAVHSTGEKNLINNKRPINGLADLRGLKIRAVPNPLFISTEQALGDSPISLSFGELYTALQTGTVNGAELPYANMVGSKLYEVAKYVTETHLALAIGGILVNEKFYQSLPTNLQKVLSDAAVKVASAEWNEVNQTDSTFLKTMTDQGVQFNALSADELARWRAAVQPVWQSALKDYGTDAAKWVGEIQSVQ